MPQNPKLVARRVDCPPPAWQEPAKFRPCPLLQDFEAHFCQAGPVQTQSACRAQREIDDPPTDERAAIVDSHYDRFSVSHVDDPYFSAEWEAPMSGGVPLRIEFFPIG